MVIFVGVINLYAIFKPVMQVAKRAFYRNILVTGEENIPKNKPVLIASNHPSAFMDPIWVGLTMKPQIHFLARGDVFKKPIAKWALGQMNILPIFRKEDSENNHEKNELTYNLCADIFKQNKFIVIYPEGYCVQEKKLRPLKKGATRLAFFTLEKFNWDLDLYILPTGVNYSNPNLFQSDLVINYGKPIRVTDYKEEYLKDKNKVNTDLTRYLEDRLKELLIIIDKKEHEILAEGIEKIYHNEFQTNYHVNFSNKKQVYQLRKAIGKTLNLSNQSNETETNQLAVQVKDYFKNLEQSGLRDWLFLKGVKKQNTLPKLLLFALLSPFMGPAFLFNYLTFKFPHRLASKSIKNIEFYPSVLIGSGAMMFALFYIISSLIIAFFLPSIFLAPLVTVFLIMWAFGTIPYYRLYAKLKGIFRLNTMLSNDKNTLDNLFKEREEIKIKIERILSTYPLDLK